MGISVHGASGAFFILISNKMLYLKFRVLRTLVPHMGSRMCSGMRPNCS